MLTDLGFETLRVKYTNYLLGSQNTQQLIKRYHQTLDSFKRYQ